MDELEAKQIAILDGLRKASGKAPFPRKQGKVQKVLGQEQIPGRGSKRLNIPTSTSATSYQPKKFKNEPMKPEASSMRIGSKFLYEQFAIEEDFPTRAPQNAVQIDENSNVDKEVEAVDVKDRNCRIPAVSLAIPTGEYVATNFMMESVQEEIANEFNEGFDAIQVQPGIEVPKNPGETNKRSLTRNGQLCCLAGAHAVFDFELGVMKPDNVVKDVMSKLRKNKMQFSADTYFEQAGRYHQSDPVVSELFACIGFKILKENDNYEHAKLGKKPFARPDPNAFFNLKKVKETSEAHTLPSGKVITLADLIDEHLKVTLPLYDIDAMTRKLALLVSQHIIEMDPYAAGYSAPEGKSIKFVSVGDGIQMKISRIIATGLGWNSEKLSLEESRIQNICRSVMDNQFTKYRQKFDKKHLPGSSVLVARDLKGEFKNLELEYQEEEDEDQNKESDEGFEAPQQEQEDGEAENDNSIDDREEAENSVGDKN